MTPEASFGAALERLVPALARNPGNAALWAQFSELIRWFNLRHPIPPLVRGLLAKALTHPAVDPGNLVRPISTLALSRSNAFDEPLLLPLLEAAVIRDASLERQLVEIRQRMLDQALASPQLPLPVQVAIAHQCFNTEYVFAETPDESEGLQRLATRLASSPAATGHGYAAYAAYRPLASLPGAERVAQALAGTPLESLARRQILEPLEEKRRGAALTALGRSDGGISAEVRAQYESNPYPRWIRTQSQFETGSLAAILRELYPSADLAALPEGAARILVAGCGTGQNAIATARRFLASHVLAVDLSRTSLAYAQRKTLELGIVNLEYAQADLLGLSGLDERFDCIECSGVLHHLADPAAGWRTLASLLAPRGLMRIGLYSETGRRDVVRARELIAERGFEATPAGIRACRAAIRERGDDPLLARIARNEDFYSLSGCRDLLFHVQEHRFTLPAIHALLEQLDFAFLGFEFADGGATAERYRARYPADRALADLGNWHQFEQEHPDSFSRMYQFWVRARR